MTTNDLLEIYQVDTAQQLQVLLMEDLKQYTITKRSNISYQLDGIFEDSTESYEKTFQGVSPLDVLCQAITEQESGPNS